MKVCILLALVALALAGIPRPEEARDPITGPRRGPTSAPLTTKKPCVDKYSNCPTLAKTNCKQYGSKCAKVS